MKRFRFKLETLHKHRKNIEQEKKRIFGRVNQRLVSQQSKLQNLYREYENRQEKSLVSEDSRSPLLLINYTQYMSKLKHDIRTQLMDVRKTMELLEKKRRDMIKAIADRRAIEVIREKRYQEYKKMADRANTRLLDDICTQLYIRAS